MLHLQFEKSVLHQWWMFLTRRPRDTPTPIPYLHTGISWSWYPPAELNPEVELYFLWESWVMSSYPEWLLEPAHYLYQSHLHANSETVPKVRFLNLVLKWFYTCLCQSSPAFSYVIRACHMSHFSNVQMVALCSASIWAPLILHAPRWQSFIEETEDEGGASIFQALFVSSLSTTVNGAFVQFFKWQSEWWQSTAPLGQEHPSQSLHLCWFPASLKAQNLVHWNWLLADHKWHQLSISIFYTT